ncbi:MAG: hypothetical protein ACLRSL_05565 [Streptococcus sp.]
MRKVRSEDFYHYGLGESLLQSSRVVPKGLADPDGPYADYFYFIESDKEPNNW